MLSLKIYGWSLQINTSTLQTHSRLLVLLGSSLPLSFSPVSDSNCLIRERTEGIASPSSVPLIFFTSLLLCKITSYTQSYQPRRDVMFIFSHKRCYDSRHRIPWIFRTTPYHSDVIKLQITAIVLCLIK